eukprot:TRINITY_DN32401_c0_g1_i1.p1 TRINITY_DN32401_c0_g1~~TRINITY_DN32401_c0_g1_i1.p1  ORF type:complete len:651 (+),score=186.85 TRINITY_DN32401_c0_g1_i1:79-2031(+)
MSGKFVMSDNLAREEQARCRELRRRTAQYINKFQEACDPWFRESASDDRRTSAEIATDTYKAKKRGVTQVVAAKRRRVLDGDEEMPSQRMQMYTSDGKLASTRKDSMEAVVCLNCLCTGHMINECTSMKVTLPDTICRKHLAGMCSDPCPHRRRHIGHETARRFVTRAVDGIMKSQFGSALVSDKPPKPLATQVQERRRQEAAVPARRQRPPDEHEDMEEAMQLPSARAGVETLIAQNAEPDDDRPVPNARWAHAAVAATAARLVRRFPACDTDLLTEVLTVSEGDEAVAVQKLREMGVPEIKMSKRFLGVAAASAAADAATSADKPARPMKAATSLWNRRNPRPLGTESKRGHLVPLQPWIRRFLVFAFAMRRAKERFVEGVAREANREPSPEMDEAGGGDTPEPSPRRVRSAADYWSLDADMLQRDSVGRFIAGFIYDPPLGLLRLIETVENHPFCPRLLRRPGFAGMVNLCRNRIASWTDMIGPDPDYEAPHKMLLRMIGLLDDAESLALCSRNEVVSILVCIQCHKKLPVLLSTSVGQSRHKDLYDCVRKNSFGSFRIDSQAILRMLDCIGRKQPQSLLQLRRRLATHPALPNLPGVQHRLARIDECERAGDFDGAQQLLETAISQIDRIANNSSVCQQYQNIYTA